MKKDFNKICLWLLSLIIFVSCSNGATSENNSKSSIQSSVLNSDSISSTMTTEDTATLIINEVCSKNRYSFLDTYEEDSDWIELYNTASYSIDLNGWGLSNSRGNPYLFTFEHYIVEPNDFVIVVASGRDVKINDGEYHLPFTLSQKNGGTLYLSNNKQIVSQVKFPGLKDDISYGLLDGAYKMTYPTPGKENKEEYIEKQILDMPTFSKPSGKYNEAFDLEITSKYGYNIYYSIDSSTPTSESTQYSSPIRIYDRSSEENIISARTDITASEIPYVPTSPVNKCMVIRAICYDDNGNYSAVASASYWINQEEFLEDGVSVMSISTDFDNLFGYEEGIYCNGKVYDDWINSDEYDPDLKYNRQPTNYIQTGFEWERIGNVSYIDENGEDVCDQTIGLRIKGNATRGYRKKSFNIFSRYTYDGNNKFTYKFNGKKCEKLAVRSGGNNIAFPITDPINSMVAKANNLNFETQDTTPTYLFLNGEFWGIYYLTDSYDSRYIEEKYGIEDSIIIKKQVEAGYETDYSKIQSARKLLQSDMTIPSNYEKFKKMVDIESFIDYNLFHLFIDTNDFVIFSGNSECWMSRVIDENVNKSDGLMRFMLFDTDYSSGSNYSADHNPFLLDNFKNRLTNLMKNEEFFNKMYNRAKEINEMLSKEEILTMVKDYYAKNERLIRQNNLRYYGKEEAGQTDRYTKLIDFYTNRSNYFVSFFETTSFD